MDTNKGDEVPEVMRKVDFRNDQLTTRDKDYIAKMTESHKKKVAHFARAKSFRRNTFIGVGLATVALGVCILSTKWFMCV